MSIDLSMVGTGTTLPVVHRVERMMNKADTEPEISASETAEVRIQRDSAGFPRYAWRPFLRNRMCLAGMPAHHVGNGVLHLLVDDFGRMTLLTAPSQDADLLPVADDEGGMGGLFVVVQRGIPDARVCGLTALDPGCVRESFVIERSPTAVTLAGHWCGEGGDLEWSVCAAIHPERPFLLVEVALWGVSDSPDSYHVRLVLRPRGWDSGRSGTFRRGASVIVPVDRENGIELFGITDGGGTITELAEGLVIDAPARPPAAGLTEQTPEQDEQEGLRARFVVGCGRDCSVGWLQRVWEEMTAEGRDGLAAMLVKRLDANGSIRIPELPMRDERLWCEGRLLSFVALLPGQAAHVVLLPGIVRDDSSVPDRGGGRDVLPVWESVSLALPLAELSPEICEGILLKATKHYVRNIGIRGGILDPGTGVWLLAGWAWLAEMLPERRDILDGSLSGNPEAPPEADAGTVWEAIETVFRCLRETSENTLHGALPTGRQDAVALGGDCEGESILCTAIGTWALQHLVALAWRKGSESLAEEFEECRKKWAAAVAEAFDGDWFRRAWTRDGRPVGTYAAGRVYADVQAWAVLARCGTPDQRRRALDAVLVRCRDDCGLRIMAPPVTGPRSHPPFVQAPPGMGWNGGVCARAGAWTVWALCAEGRTAEAVDVWRRVSVLRRRARTSSGNEIGAIPPHWAESSCFAGSAESATAGLPWRPGAQQGSRGLPDVHALAWQGFALRRILEKKV